MEAAFSGYCRVLDAPRLFFCEADSTEREAECDYAGCAYASECPIGRQITDFFAQFQWEAAET